MSIKFEIPSTIENIHTVNTTVTGTFTLDGYVINPAGATIDQVLKYNGSAFVPQDEAGGGGAVASVSNSDGSLTISPTTGTVVASLNVGHANTFSVTQTFSNHIVVDGYTIDIAAGASTNQALQYNGTKFLAATISAIDTVTASGISTFTGDVIISKNAVGTTQYNSFALKNTTAATSGVAQYSPMSTFRGEQWRSDLTATRTLEAGLQLQTYSFGSRAGELSHYFRDNNTGSWTYHGGIGVFGSSTYLYMQNDTEGSYVQLQTDANETQIFSNRQMSFSAGDTASAFPSITLSASDGSTNNQFLLLALPNVSSITAEYNDLKAVPNNATITFNASGNPTVTNQRQFYFGRRKLAGSGGTVTFTNAATVAISDAPSAESGATITNRYALLVEAGTTYLKGNLNSDGIFKLDTVPNNSVGGDTSINVFTTDVTQTSDATQTTIYSKTLNDNTAYRFEIRVLACNTAANEYALYGKTVLVRRSGGGATIQGSVQDVFTDIESTGGMDATFTVSSNDLRVSVTGKAATLINWVATVTYQALISNG